MFLVVTNSEDGLEIRGFVEEADAVADALDLKEYVEGGVSEDESVLMIKVYKIPVDADFRIIYNCGVAFTGNVIEI